MGVGWGCDFGDIHHKKTETSSIKNNFRPDYVLESVQILDNHLSIHRFNIIKIHKSGEIALGTH